MASTATEETKTAAATGINTGVPGFQPLVLEKDVASTANFSEIQVTHYVFDWDFDLFKQELKGTATLELVVNPTTNALPASLLLDSHHLAIASVQQVAADGAKTDLSFKLQAFTGFGGALNISLEGAKLEDRTGEKQTKGEKGLVLQITYSAGAEGDCIAWLKPAQTADKKLPYMFTQGQACLNRALFPCQDTPAIRATYAATVRCHKQFTAIMAAKSLNTMEGGQLLGAAVAGNDEIHEFKFVMEQSIPIYLLAMAIGDLRYADIGPRSKVWAEPSVVDAAKAEFVDVTEKYIAAGEKLFGPYHWEVYDLLVMPPCFAYGGMENPRLTFVTPCLLAGDQSLADVVAHEIAHSWFGNLVTNASWSEFFLNEGFTMTAQRRITDEVHGKVFTALEARTGITLLREEMEDIGMDNPLTKLRTPLAEGVDPDDTYNQTPYEKGYCFLSYLREQVGGDEKFDPFMKQWAQGHAFSCVTAEQMLAEFLDTFPAMKEANLAERKGFEFDTWLNAGGWPAFVPDLSLANELTDPAEAVANSWLEHGASATDGVDRDISSWGTYPVLFLLDLWGSKPAGALSNEVMAAIDAAYKFSDARNAEIRLRWSQLIIKQNYEAGASVITSFLHDQGKQRYTLPIYRLLAKAEPFFRTLAVTTFADTKEGLASALASHVSKALDAAGLSDGAGAGTGAGAN